MHFVFPILDSSVFRHLEGVVLEILRRGHKVTVVTNLHGEKSHPNLNDRALLAAVEANPHFKLENWIVRDTKKSRVIRLSRELLNYSVYYRLGHPSSGLRSRWKKYLSDRVWCIVGNSIAGRILASTPARVTLRCFEKMAPEVRDISHWLANLDANAVVASPFLLPDSRELEYVKAAKASGIPSMVAILSWDNLTTKGTFSLFPNRVFVWNEALRDEAVALHDVPAEQITVTGSPTFDYWFAMQPTLDRQAFARQCGIDFNRPYVVYLCSSRGMIEEEKRYVADLAAEMRANPATREATLLVRPHPLNILDWSDVESDQIRVWPPRGEFTDNLETRRNFFHTLYYSAATVGVNTSAMLEAAVADKPCITVIDPRYQSAQSGMGHFRHLLDGGFLQVTNSYGDATTRLGEIFAGNDPLAAGRRAFVKRFIRPQGLERPAAEVMADAILAEVNLQSQYGRKLS